TVSTTRYADAAADEDRPAMGTHLVEGLRMVMFLCVPATVGLIVLGEPIIRLIYQHGRFMLRDTGATTSALHYYVIGLVAYAAVKGGVVWAVHLGLDRTIGHVGTVRRLIETLAPAAVGAIVYAGACAVLRIEELGQFTDRLMRKLRRRRT